LFELKKGERSIGRTIAVNTTSSILARGIQTVAAAFTIPLVINGLGGTAEYGVWITVTSIVTLLGFTDLGVANGVARLVARFRGKGWDISQLLHTMMYAEILAALIVVLCTLCISFILPDRMALKEIDVIIIRQAILIKGFAMALSMPLRLGIPILTGHQQYGLHVVGDTVATVLTLVGVVAHVYIGNLDYLGLAIITGMSLIIGSLIGLFFAWKTLYKKNIFKVKASYRILRVGLGLGWASLVISLSVSLSQRGMAVFLGMFGNPVWAAMWAIAVFVSTQISHIGSSLSAPFTTFASEFDAKKQIERLQRSASTAISIIAGFVSTVTVGAFIFGERLIALFLPKIYAEGRAVELTILIVLLLAIHAVTLPLTVFQKIMLGTKRHWSVARWRLLSALIGAISLFVLFPIMGLWATIPAEFIFLFLPVAGLYFPAYRSFTRDSFGKDMKTIALVLFLPMVIGLAFWIAGFKAPNTLSCSVLLACLYAIFAGLTVFLNIPGLRTRFINFL
jgi:O-antigen/teichoic acid export membrane protein